MLTDKQILEQLAGWPAVEESDADPEAWMYVTQEAFGPHTLDIVKRKLIENLGTKDLIVTVYYESARDLYKIGARRA